MFLGLNYPSAIGFWYCKFSTFCVGKKFFAPLVGNPNPCSQRLFTAHGLGFKSIGTKKITDT
jgi:hypothetical protein